MMISFSKRKTMFKPKYLSKKKLPLFLNHLFIIEKPSDVAADVLWL